MKKTLVALCALLAGTAMAQSSVTVFGVVDAAARSLKGDDTLKLLSNEGRSQSRLGFRGVEDLGGGMKASFWIEHGLNVDEGTPTASQFWGRRATVSLTGDFGEIRLGRHKHFSRLVVDDFDPFETSGMNDMSRIFSGLGLTTAVANANGSGFVNRADNQVAYALPNMGSFYGGVDVAAGEGADSNKTTSARFGYRTKDVHVAVGIGQHGVSNKLKTKTLGGSYTFGAVTVLGQYSKLDRGALNQKVWSLGAMVAVGSQGKFIVNMAKADGNSTQLVAGVAQQNTDASLFGIGYDHNLSKRTTVYTTYGRINNDGATKYVLNGAKGAANIAAGSPLGRDSTGYEVGIRHRF